MGGFLLGVKQGGVLITDFLLHKLQNPRFVFPALVTYLQDGIKKSWEIVKAHDSVAILLYHTQKNSLIVVKQFRPATFANGHPTGMSIELCAGIVDKPISLEEIAKEEIVEECGYQVKEIEKITSFYTSVGFAGSKQTLFYATIDETMRISSGGGIGDESIEVICLSLKEARELMEDEETIKTPGLLYAFSWWFERHKLA